MKNHKFAAVVLRIFGVFALYHFFDEAVGVMNAVSGLATKKGVSAQVFALHGLVSLFAGIYLLFKTDMILSRYLKDSIFATTDSPTGESEAKYLFALSLKAFGLYFFYEFMHNLVTAYNVAAGNWTPGDTAASAFVILGIFHLIVSLWFLFRTVSIVDFVCRDLPVPQFERE